MSARIGQIIHGRYRVLSQIGKGGMSAVYLVQDLRSGEKFAMKEILQNGRYYSQNAAALPQNEGNCLGFAEAELLSGLDHPAFPKIHEVIRDAEGTVFIIREYVEGESLDRLLRRGPFSPEAVRQCGIALGEALHYLHSQDPPVIYRDMKPANIIRRPDGQLVLIDLGISGSRSLNRDAGGNAGTRGYAAPEQYSSGGEDLSADIYALGISLFELLTGIPPREDPWAYRFHPVRRIRPDCPEELERVINQCIRFAPEDRYPDCSCLLEKLRAVPAMTSETTGRTRRPRRWQRWPSSIRLQGIIIVLLAVLLAAVPVSVLTAKALAGAEYRQLIAGTESGSLEEQEACFAKGFQSEMADASLYERYLDWCEKNERFGSRQLALLTTSWERDQGKLERDSRCGSLGMQAGRLCLFAETEEWSMQTRAAEAAAWFDLAAAKGEADAGLYCRICSFFRNYGAVRTQGQSQAPEDLSAMLQEAQEWLTEASRTPDLEDEQKLLLAGELADLVNVHRKALAEGGISKARVLLLYGQIRDLYSSSDSVEASRKEELEMRLDRYMDNLERVYENMEKRVAADNERRVGK